MILVTAMYKHHGVGIWVSSTGLSQHGREVETEIAMYRRDSGSYVFLDISELGTYSSLRI